MKLVLLLGCFVAGALAGYVPSVGKAAAGVRDWSSRADAAEKWGADRKNYGRDNSFQAAEAARANAKNQRTGSDYGNRASNWDQNASAFKKGANQAAASAWQKNQWGQKNDADKSLKDTLWAKGSKWHQGRRKSDSLDFNYDKGFDLNDHQNGGYQAAESSRSHALDDQRDSAASYDRNVDKAAAWASAADANQANRKAAWQQAAAAADSKWDKFGRSKANAASANGRSKDWAQNLDKSEGANRFWTDAKRRASDIYKKQASADGSYKRNALGNKGVGYGDNLYAYGVAGKVGYAPKNAYLLGPYGVNRYAKAGGVKDAAQAWDQAARAGLRNTEDAASKDVTNTKFSRDQWLKDRVKGFDRRNKAAADDKGFSDWAQQAAKSAKKADAASANAASKWNKDQSQSKFNEDVWKKDAAKKRLSDRSKDNKAFKKWFSNKKRNGNNWEKVKYDRDQKDDAFGYDTAAKKDWAQSANSRHWNQAADASARDAKAARANAAGRTASNADWKKDAKGWQNAFAAANAKDAAQKRRQNNADWKQDAAQRSYGARAQNQQKWDRDANRYKAAAAVAPRYGLTNAYYGIPNGGAYYGRVPAVGGYYNGYPNVYNNKFLGKAGGYYF